MNHPEKFSIGTRFYLHGGQSDVTEIRPPDGTRYRFPGNLEGYYTVVARFLSGVICERESMKGIKDSSRYEFDVHTLMAVVLEVEA